MGEYVGNPSLLEGAVGEVDVVLTLLPMVVLIAEPIAVLMPVVDEVGASVILSPPTKLADAEVGLKVIMTPSSILVVAEVGESVMLTPPVKLVFAVVGGKDPSRASVTMAEGAPEVGATIPLDAVGNAEVALLLSTTDGEGAVVSLPLAGVAVTPKSTPKLPLSAWYANSLLAPTA